MSDQEDDKKILNEDASQPEDENQPKIDSENQTPTDQNQNFETTSDGNETKTENLVENQEISADEKKIDESESSSCLLYTSPSPRDRTRSRMPSSA